LTLEEINWALTIGAGDASEGLVKKNLYFDVEQTIKKHCGCFLRIIEAKVYFVHLTAMEFLTRSNQISIPASGSWKASIDPVESNVLLSTICVSYLSMDDFRQNPLQAFNYQGSWTYNIREERQKHLDNYTKYHPFLDYASKYWAQHFRTAEAVSSQLLPNPELICEAGSPIFLTWLPIFWPSIFRTNPPKFTTLAICSYFGFETVVRRLLVRENIEVNAKVEEDGGTALHWAARHGNEVVVRLLLERGADVDAKDDGGKTALH
jgi:ankyrin repeat domain-containing protein 50